MGMIALNPGSTTGVRWIAHSPCGGAPSIVDMRSGATPLGAIETAMIDAAYVQVGRFLGLPTHGYLGGTDAKIVDAQAGLETGASVVVGALAGIDPRIGKVFAIAASFALTWLLRSKIVFRSLS